jgi:hypothetical protein
MIEEKAGEQADTDAQLQDMNVRLQVARFVGFEKTCKEDLGGVAQEVAVVINDEGDRRRVGDERLVTAISEVLLAQFPFERVGERHKILHHGPTVLGVGQDVLGNRLRRRKLSGVFFRFGERARHVANSWSVKRLMTPTGKLSDNPGALTDHQRLETQGVGFP